MLKPRQIARNSGLRWFLVAAFAGVAIVVALLRGDPVTELHGASRVLDGDTLIVADRKVRLAGLDAPEIDQICTNGAGSGWVCGTAARQGLSEMIGGGAVDCTGDADDSYGRLLAVCTAAGTDLGAELVRRGLAIARERYVAEESDARSAGAGIWAGEFDDPEDWRRRHEDGSGRMGLMDWILKMFTS